MFKTNNCHKIYSFWLILRDILIQIVLQYNYKKLDSVYDKILFNNFIRLKMHNFSHVHLKRKKQFLDNQLRSNKSGGGLRIPSKELKNQLQCNYHTKNNQKNCQQTQTQQLVNFSSLKSSSIFEQSNKPSVDQSSVNINDQFNFSTFSAIIKASNKKLTANDAIKLKQHIFKDYLRQVKKCAKIFQEKGEDQKARTQKHCIQALQSSRLTQKENKISSIRSSSKSLTCSEKIYKSSAQYNQQQFNKHQQTNRRKVVSSVDYRQQPTESQKPLKPLKLASSVDHQKSNLTKNRNTHQQQRNGLLSNFKSSIHLGIKYCQNSNSQPSYYYSDKNQLISLKQFLILFTQSKKRERSMQRKILRKKDRQAVLTVEKRIQTTSTGRQQNLRLTSSYAKKIMSRQRNRNEQQQQQDLLQMIKKIQ